MESFIKNRKIYSLAILEAVKSKIKTLDYNDAFLVSPVIRRL